MKVNFILITFNPIVKSKSPMSSIVQSIVTSESSSISNELMKTSTADLIIQTNSEMSSTFKQTSTTESSTVTTEPPKNTTVPEVTTTEHVWYIKDVSLTQFLDLKTRHPKLLMEAVATDQ